MVAGGDSVSIAKGVLDKPVTQPQEVFFYLWVVAIVPSFRYSIVGKIQAFPHGFPIAA